MHVPRSALPRRQQGAEVVEFVITLLLFFLVFFMIVDFSIVMFDQGTVITASRYSTRQASLYWVDPATFDPETPLQNRRLKRSMVDSVVTWADNNLLIAPGDEGLTGALEVNAAAMTGAQQVIQESDVVGVNITYPHNFLGLTGLASLSGINMGSGSTLVVE